MPKTDLSFSPADYAPVADRITPFYEQYPTGQIITRLIADTEERVVFRALVFREPGDTRPSATGWAAERVDDGEDLVGSGREASGSPPGVNRDSLGGFEIFRTAKRACLPGGVGGE